MNYTFAETFAGAGGTHCGFKKAKFTTDLRGQQINTDLRSQKMTTDLRSKNCGQKMMVKNMSEKVEKWSQQGSQHGSKMEPRKQAMRFSNKMPLGSLSDRLWPSFEALWSLLGVRGRRDTLEEEAARFEAWSGLWAVGDHRLRELCRN